MNCDSNENQNNLKSQKKLQNDFFDENPAVWKKNIFLFCERFPALAKKYKITQKSFPPKNNALPFFVHRAKNGDWTAECDGVFLHSKYDPKKEAKNFLENAMRSNFEKKTSFQKRFSCKEDFSLALFLGISLGYAAIEEAKLFPQKTLMIVEPNADFFFAAMKFVDFSAIFSLSKCILALEANENEILSLIFACKIPLKSCCVFYMKNLRRNCEKYFKNVQEIFFRAQKKDEVNQNTLKKFGTLWTKNTLKNIFRLTSCAPLKLLENSAKLMLKNPKAIILGAGPTLCEILPHLKIFSQKFLIICVDSALRACLRAGFEPDFVLIFDPQYAAARHILDLRSKSSILICGLDVWPSVFRFCCKKFFLSGQLFPLGKYFEKKTQNLGTLESGGSVSTAAWDFARFLGVNEIYFSGLDLGFPDGKTHIQGATFEEQAHQKSFRLSPFQNEILRILFSANNFYDFNYENKKILTDDKMKLFAWWLESKIAMQKNHPKTFCLSKKSLKIPGIENAKIEDLLKSKDIIEEKNRFFKFLDEKKSEINEKMVNNAIFDLKNDLEKIIKNANRAKILSEKVLQKKLNPKDAKNEIAELEREIFCGEKNEIANLFFPSENQIEKKFKRENLNAINENHFEFLKSKITFSEVEKSAKKILEKFL